MPASFEPLIQLGYALGVAPDIKFPALLDLDNPLGAELLACPSAMQAFTSTWPSDAHFITYRIEHQGAPEQRWPRLKKRRSPCLAQIRAAGGDVRVQAFVFDLDWKRFLGVEDEVPTTTELLVTFWDRFLALPENIREWALGSLSYYYSTMNGLRLVYFLTKPLVVEKGELLQKHLFKVLEAAGIPLDPRCLDWTHLFRLPRVVRNDAKVNNRPTPQVPLDESWPCIGGTVGLLDPVALAGSGVLASITPARAVVNYECPDDSVAYSLLGTDAARPDWHREIREYLKGRHCFTTIFQERDLASIGHRDDTIQMFVGEVAVAMRKIKERGWDVGPAHIYALLLGPILQLEPDDGTPDWRAPLWKATQTYWASELDKIQAEKVAEETRNLVSLSLTERIVEGMRKWCKDPALMSADEREAAQYAYEHMIAGSLSGNYYLIRPDGTFDDVPVKQPLLAARIRECGLDPIICTGYKDDKGEWKRIPISNIIDRHATVFHSVEGHARGPGNWIRNMGGHQPTMVMRLYSRRSDIVPTFHRDVDDWLRVLGGVQYERLCAWVGHALAFDTGPIAALALVGSKGVGKKMFVRGLAECLSADGFAGADEMGAYQYGLLKSPFLVINEGFKRTPTGFDPADFFRLLTGGDSITVNQKYRDPVEIRAPIRVVILANNHDILSTIAGANRNLSQEDKLALAQRLIVIRVTEKAEGWLRMRGGMAFTLGWIANDAGGGSNFKLAEHFMWLYGRRPAVDYGNRFLMEGTPEDGLVAALSTRSGHAPQIIEILVAMVEAASAGRPVVGLVIQREEAPLVLGAEHAGALPRVWVTAHSVSAWARMDNSLREKVPQKEVGKVFRGLVRRSEPEGGRYLSWPEVDHGAKRAHWFCLDGEVLLKEAHELGYACEALEGLCQEADQSKTTRILPDPEQDEGIG